MQRTSPNSVFFTSYNLYNLFADDSPAASEHYRTIVGVIRSLDTDVLAVQEILAPDGPTAGQRLRQLADDTGLRCEVPGPEVAPEAALAVGGHGYQVGLMWRDGIERVEGGGRPRTAEVTKAGFDLGDRDGAEGPVDLRTQGRQSAIAHGRPVLHTAQYLVDRVRGIIEGDANPDVFLPKLVDLFVKGKFPIDRLVTFYPFARINDAIADALSGKVVKPILRF